MITTISGPNAFMLKRELNHRIESFRKEHGDMAIERLDGEEVGIEQVSGALESLPFLSPKKLVVLRSPSAQKQFIERAETLLADLPETTDVIILEPQVDRRSSYFKFLKKSTEFVDCQELDNQQLGRWLVKQAEEENAKLSLSDAIYLIERVGNNQQLLYNELQKLINYLPDITRQTIDLLTEPTPQSTVFQLLDAMFAGNTKKALAVYEEQRLQQVDPHAIMAMLAWQLHVVALVHTGQSKTDQEIAKAGKLNPFVVQKSRRIAAQLTRSELKELIHRTLELDVKLKTQSIDADDALKQLIISVAKQQR